MQIHGWTVEVGEHASRSGEPPKQQVVLRKGKERVLTRSAPGVDQNILVQRALIEALRIDLKNARKEDVPLVRSQISRAVIEERVMMMDRNPVPEGESVVEA